MSENPTRVSSMPRGWGGLLTTEDEHVELGEHGGRRVRGVVRRRVLRVGVRQLRLVAFHLRPVAVEVDGTRVAIPVPADPALLLLRRALLLLVVSLVLRRTLPRLVERRWGR